MNYEGWWEVGFLIARQGEEAASLEMLGSATERVEVLTGSC